jgi:hypothetical protein
MIEATTREATVRARLDVACYALGYRAEAFTAHGDAR